MIETLQNFLLDNFSLNQRASLYLANIATILIIIIACVLSNLIIKKIVLRIIHAHISRTKIKWDDFLIKRKVFEQFALIIPAIIIHEGASLFPQHTAWVQKVTFVCISFIIVATINKLIETINDIYMTNDAAKTHSIRGYLQILKIFIIAAALIIVVSALVNRSPWVLLSGLGAATAILLLIFQNTILGLVAGVQLSTNNMISIGDWIEVPSQGVDGDVIEVTLHTVKVQNWDKTIVTIPPQALISGSFKNWKGMHESGGRRIKRCVYIDMSSIKFCDENMLRRFSEIQYIKDYIKSRSEEIAKYNENIKVNTTSIVNGRHMTNVGTFRAYIKSYLINHPKINQSMTMIVRQLQPIENGLPIEIYCFTNTTNWVEYEGIQSDIFDHILSIVREFDLEIHENPTGSDIRRLK